MDDVAAAPRLKPMPVLLLTVLLPFGLGYFLSYAFRTVNAIIAPQLVQDGGLSAADLGVMTSAYFFAFSAAQLPLGMALDRFGPRKVQTVLLGVAALGAALFAMAHDAGAMIVARILLGAGASGCMISALKANVMWFPRERLPFLNGLAFAFGTTGALSTTVPLEMLIETTDWRTVFFGLAAVTVLVAAVINRVVPERPQEHRTAVAGQSALKRQLSDLGQIYRSRFFWRLTAVIVLHNGVFMSYQSLWTAPWLHDVAGLDRAGVADAMFAFNIGMLIGVLSIGFLAERIQRIGVPPIVIAGGGIAVSIGVQCLFAAQWTDWPQVLCFLYGYFGSSAVLTYAVLNQHFPAHLAGRVNTAQNMLAFMCAFTTQWLVGVVIGLYPSPGNGLYSIEGQQVAQTIFIVLELAGFTYFIWPRRKRVHEPA